MARSPRETYVPDDERGSLRALLDLIATGHGAEDENGGLTLAGAGSGSAVAVPRQVQRILEQVVRALDEGLTVTVTPLGRTVTTQQAADLLGVSRPTVVRLLDDGRIPHERTGSHRRLQLHDVLAYREDRRARQLAAIEATSVPLEDEDDLDDTLALLRQVRARQAAARRRNQPVGGG